MGADRRLLLSSSNFTFTPPTSLPKDDLADQMSRLTFSPHCPPPPESGRCALQIIADETLCEIFGWVMEYTLISANGPPNYPPYGRRLLDPRPTMQPFLLYQVCRHWRNVCQEMTSLWKTLRIWHTNHSDIWRGFISRSGRRLMDVEICLPNHQSIELWDRPRIHEFKQLFKAIRNCAPRIRSLIIHAPNPTLRIIINDAFEKIHFSSLVSFQVSQAGPQKALCFFGPMSFNHEVFRSLHLFNAMVECYASCLKNLENLTLVGSSGTLLDQEKLTHPTYPAIPDGPTLTNLQSLIIAGTYPIPNRYRSPQPSFDITKLTFLHLSQFRESENNISVSDSVTTLSRMVCYGPNLKGLQLEAFEPMAFQNFMEQVVACPFRPQYPCLQWLFFTFIQTASISADFLRAFPEVSNLRLLHSNATPIAKCLEDCPELCPKLLAISVDGRFYNRNLAPV